MDLKLLVSLSLCCWTAAARSYWSDKPKVIGPDEIQDGQTAEVSCTLPIDYRGGECRLYRGNSRRPFQVMIATDYICTFYLSSAVLLGRRPVGTLLRLRCDYKLQDYTSPPSDHKPLVVWGTRPRPTLSVSRRFLSPDDAVELTCSPPEDQLAVSCVFQRGEFFVISGACSRNLTGRRIAKWADPALVLPAAMNCIYKPDRDLYIQSEPSERHLVLIVDATRASSSVDCKVSVGADQLEAFQDGSWTSHGPNGTRVTVAVTTGNLTLNETCKYVESSNRRE